MSDIESEIGLREQRQHRQEEGGNDEERMRPFKVFETCGGFHSAFTLSFVLDDLLSLFFRLLSLIWLTCFLIILFSLHLHFLHQFLQISTFSEFIGRSSEDLPSFIKCNHLVHFLHKLDSMCHQDNGFVF